ncbi:polyprenyl synthetase family protein [Chengkuizengella axinellae]|uniref:Polyprenyl synthetase family protein n=1 Tax=Chengkuizengella axinellae TaxID=3064388 RepID=A0ABT9IW74_9BACL|nr:farnesyl diphosphate synthase [Chengkuizengella sp. 2205SS18-9]MDP5273608.1 polyprenyl synthetase family protein [Chengkuizengella sp. 2205SS18-9]
MDTITEFINYYGLEVEKELKQIFPQNWHIPERLEESMNYSLFAGGKRMRPILMIAAAEALNGSISSVLPAAGALEMIHTYSLVHDDLPAMDDDDYRRGKLTNHKVYGEAMAILAGDALLTHSFYIVSKSLRAKDIPAETILNIIEELSTYAGPRGMVGGQVDDMDGQQGITSIEQLKQIHTHKTGDLIVCSLRAGGHIAGATANQLEALASFGYKIGLAFQIQDDILDVVGDEQKLGKPVLSDENGKKVTYPYLIGLEACTDKVKELTEEAKQVIIEANFPNPNRLLEIADFLMQREH